jgi:hypothetical protein
MEGKERKKERTNEQTIIKEGKERKGGGVKKEGRKKETNKRTNKRMNERMNERKKEKYK